MSLYKEFRWPSFLFHYFVSEDPFREISSERNPPAVCVSLSIYIIRHSSPTHSHSHSHSHSPSPSPSPSTSYAFISYIMPTNQTSVDYPTGETAQEIGLPYVPQCYQIPPDHNPLTPPSVTDIPAAVPVVDLVGLRGTKEQRDCVVRNIGDACLRMGFFQVRNISLN